MPETAQGAPGSMCHFKLQSEAWQQGTHVRARRQVWGVWGLHEPYECRVVVHISICGMFEG